MSTFLPGRNKRVPLPLALLFSEKHLNASGGLLTALFMRTAVRLLPPSEKSGGNNPAVVQNQQIAFAQMFGKFPEHAVGVLTRSPIERQHARAGSLDRWLLRNQLAGKIVVEIRDKHLEKFIWQNKPPPEGVRGPARRSIPAA